MLVRGFATSASPSVYKAVLLPGDGIGPEVAQATKLVLEAANAPLLFTEMQVGVSALERGYKDVLPDETVESIRKRGLALKGPCSTPLGKGFTSVNVDLRKRLDLFAAIRPVRSMKGVPTRYQDVDIVVFRENIEGMYSRIEAVITENPRVVTSLKVATERGCTRIARAAFEYAMVNKRKKVTAMHKANIMQLTDGLFMQCAQKVARDYPSIQYEEFIIDAGCMKLVQDPTQFDVLLLQNLYGDIMSDLAAGLVGGLGVVPGGNLGEDGIGVFEAVHGSAPEIAGKNLANPMALLMSGVMMLNHIARTRDDKFASDCAARIKCAYSEALEAGEKTADLGGTLGTMQFAEAVARRLA